MRTSLSPIAYLRGLSAGRAVLWCYLIWYLVMAGFYFDPSPRQWLTSVGLSVIIGLALVLSVSTPGAPRPDRWQLMRLFLVPFCVSSFAALVKDRGFILIFSPKLAETFLALALCGAFCLTVVLIKRLGAPRRT
jgi:hypothetical protein